MNKLTPEENNYKCVQLIGELSDWGNHILMPFGVTLCGMPTIDADKEQFPALKEKALSDIISEYKELGEWNITCKRCLEVFETIERGNQSRKAKNKTPS